MKKTLTGLLLATTMVVAIPCLLFAQDATANSDNDKVRVGVFDSRAVAMAYYRSSSFSEELNALHAELKTAQKAGVEESVKELEAKGIALQNLMHKQGFGSWPIDDIVKRINDQLPTIAERAGVALIVSDGPLLYCEWEVMQFGRRRIDGV